MMFFRATGYSRSELQRAFDAYAAAHGAHLASEALERATGARDVASVPELRIVNGLAELVCGYSFAAVKPVDNVVRLHEALALIRKKAFAARP